MAARARDHAYFMRLRDIMGKALEEITDDDIAFLQRRELQQLAELFSVPSSKNTSTARLTRDLANARDLAVITADAAAKAAADAAATAALTAAAAASSTAPTPPPPSPSATAATQHQSPDDVSATVSTTALTQPTASTQPPPPPMGMSSASAPASTQPSPSVITGASGATGLPPPAAMAMAPFPPPPVDLGATTTAALQPPPPDTLAPATSAPPPAFDTQLIAAIQAAVDSSLGSKLSLLEAKISHLEALSQHSAVLPSSPPHSPARTVKRNRPRQDSSTISDWDQFSANEKRFNDENLYTTALDYDNADSDKMADAKEIESMASTNIHLMEERNQKISADYDEEDLYSGVLKKKEEEKQVESKSAAVEEKRTMNYAAAAGAAKKAVAAEGGAASANMSVAQDAQTGTATSELPVAESVDSSTEEKKGEPDEVKADAEEPQTEKEDKPKEEAKEPSKLKLNPNAKAFTFNPSAKSFTPSFAASAPPPTKNSNATKLLDAIVEVVKQSFKTRHCTVDEDQDFQQAPPIINPGYIRETLGKWLKKQSETLLNDVLPKHAKLLHLETDFKTAVSGDIPVCPELWDESEIVERVSDDRSKMRAVFYLALWSTISHTNYIVIVSILANAVIKLQNLPNTASPPEMDDIVWNIVWGYYKCSSALAAVSFVKSRFCTGVGEFKVFFISSGLMSACTIIKDLLLISSKDLNKTSFLYSDLSMAGDENSIYHYYFGRNCLPLITSSLILLVRVYVQRNVSKGINASSLRKDEIAEMLCGKKCAKADCLTQEFFMTFLVNFKDRLYWNRLLLPKLKEIKKQAEKEDSNVQTRLLHEKTKAKRDEDIEEAREPVKKRAKTNNDNHVRRNHHIDFSTTSTGVASFPIRSAERTKKAPATLATMKENANTSAQRSSPRGNAKTSAQQRTSPRGNANTSVQRRTSP